jgi:broad specificity phosphatase PhoE
VDIEKRVDGLIGKIREIHKTAVEEDKFGDVVLVAHAHILRSFTARWLALPIAAGRNFLLDAGGVGVLWFYLGFTFLMVVMNITVLTSLQWIVGMSRTVLYPWDYAYI